MCLRQFVVNVYSFCKQQPCQESVAVPPKAVVTSDTDIEDTGTPTITFKPRRRLKLACIFY